MALPTCECVKSFTEASKLDAIYCVLLEVLAGSGGGFTPPLLPSLGGTGVANLDAETITLNGGFPLAFTLTGATGVTLPTTGTLATLAGAEAFSNKTLTAPRFVSGGFIADVNGNELVVFTTTPAAVNEVTIINAGTGVAPVIIASGGDVDIDLQLGGKGSGDVAFNSDINAQGVNIDNTAGSAALGQLTFTSVGGAADPPVADGTYTVGIGGTQNGTITFANGVAIAVQEAQP